MATIFGAMNISDVDVFSDSAGQMSAWTIINEYLTATQIDSDKAYSIFVAGETTDHTSRAFLPTGGYMQASRNTSRPGARKLTGSWDVAFPIEDLRDQWAIDDVALAYMSAMQADANVKSLAQHYVNSKRLLILKALLNKTNATFTDELRGDLTIRRLANGDGSLFPPVLGTVDAAEETHYIGSNYASSAISDTNNPFVTIRDELEEHYGDAQIVAFVNNAQRAKIEALTAFIERTPSWTVPGADTTTVGGSIPGLPGRAIGSINDVLVVEWRWIPADYILGVALDQPAPLMKRVDIPASLRGFQLAAKQMEFPLIESFYRAREGYGVMNRLNGVAIHVNASTTYTNPTAYA